MMRLEDMQKAKSDWACQKEKTYSTRQKDTQLACRTIILVGFYSHFAIEGNPFQLHSGTRLEMVISYKL